MTYERKNIHAMAAYVPGEQVDAPGIVKLNTNENPYPPSPRVTAALAACDPARLRQYPPPTAGKLQDAIAGKHGLSRDNVIVTNGGDELLRMAIATFVEITDTIAVARPTVQRSCRAKEVRIENGGKGPGRADRLARA